jgi:hypothetical protein
MRLSESGGLESESGDSAPPVESGGAVGLAGVTPTLKEEGIAVPTSLVGYPDGSAIAEEFLA